MSDYNCWIRTNYFRVKDENALEELLSTCRTNGHLQLRESEEGKKYCFTCDGRIYGVPDREAPDEAEEDYGAFITGLQTLLPAGEALILMEVGHEKFKYLVGAACLLTANRMMHIDLQEAAIREARQMLGNPSYNTRIEY